MNIKNIVHKIKLGIWILTFISGVIATASIILQFFNLALISDYSINGKLIVAHCVTTIVLLAWSWIAYIIYENIGAKNNDY